MNSKNFIPVITLDGFSGSGKGTLSQLLADRLSWHYLDSGAIYRMLSWAISNSKINSENEKIVKTFLSQLKMDIRLDEQKKPQYFCNDQNITLAIRTEECSRMTSKIAALPYVRESVLKKQRDFRRTPGLVTDGRDMGTVVFPDATLKFYITASVEERANRRYNQLKMQGISGSLARIREDLEKRDEQDQQRLIAPLKPAADAIIVDTTSLTISQSLDLLMHTVKTKGISVL